MIHNNPDNRLLEFSRLSYKEKNALTEEIMGERINLTYDQAIKACMWAINSNDTLRNAFQNYQNVKKIKYLDLPKDTDFLLGAFVDKFKERIFFHVRNDVDNDTQFNDIQVDDRPFNNTQFIYDLPSNKILIYAKNNHIIEDSNLPSDLFNITSLNSGGFFSHVWSTEDFWFNNSLNHLIKNDNTQNRNLSENQEYVSDEHYKIIYKRFGQLSNADENNHFRGKSFYSTFNPAHTVLSPIDIEEEALEAKFRHTKKA